MPCRYVPLAVSRDFVGRVQAFFQQAVERTTSSTPRAVGEDGVGAAGSLARESWEMDRVLAHMAGDRARLIHGMADMEFLSYISQ
jgi:hypothetical protein